jgi:hypothetical protein
VHSAKSILWFLIAGISGSFEPLSGSNYYLKEIIMDAIKKVETSVKNAGRNIGKAAKSVAVAEKKVAKSAKKAVSTAKNCF